MRRPHAIVAAALCSACQSPEVFTLEAIPADIRWLAAYGTDSDGVARVSALEDRSGGAPVLGSLSRGRTVSLLGWRDARLARLLEGAPAERSLAPAVGCQQRLPKPDFAVAAREGGVFEALAPENAPAVTAPWLSRSCPDVVSGREVAIVRQRIALPVSCGASLREGDDCELRVSWRDEVCQGPVDVVAFEVVDIEGTACNDAMSERHCVVADPVDLVLECEVGEQRVTVSPVRAPRAPPVEVVTATVGRRTPDLDPGGRIGARWAGHYAGFAEINELVVLEDRAIVLGRQVTGCRATFVSLDLETLARLPGPREWTHCNSSAIADARGAGFVAAFNDDLNRTADFEVARFDPAGSQVGARVRLPIPRGTTNVAPIGMHYVGTSTDSLVVLITRASGVGGVVETYGHLFVLDPETLAVRTSTGSRYDQRASTPLSGSRLAVADDASDHVFVYDVRDPTVGPLDRVRLHELGAAELNALMYHAPTRRLLAAAPTGRPAGLFWAEEGMHFESVYVTEPGARPTVIARWPADPRLVIVGTLTWSPTEPEMAARVLFYEPATKQVLAGAPRIGSGIVSLARTDRKGRVWMLLPWTAQVARISAAR